MSNVIMTLGAYSKIPYYVSDDCRNLYCIEELCYYLFHNAYLLDDRFVTKELAEWIDGELGLEDIARETIKLVGRPGALTKLVTLLAEKVGFYSEEEWRNLLSDIGVNNRLTVEERRKCRADGFLNAGRYMLACDEYNVVLREIEGDQIKLRAKVYHNLGVCYAKLFMFDKAADSFEKAYDAYANTESYVSMLAAKKLYMSSADYLTYLSEHKESYEDSLEVERKLEILKEKWETQPTKMFIDEISGLKQQGSSFYDGIDSMTDEVKEEYKECSFRNASY